MEDEAAVHRAQGQICRALRHEVIGARAMLPFDPTDRPDVGVWLRRQLATSRTERYDGTVAYTAKALCLDALTEARKARRHTDHRDSKAVGMAGLGTLEALASKPPWWAGWPEALEWVADLVAGAARAVVQAAPHARKRKAVAVLSCLGRTVAVMKSSFAPGIANQYIAHLITNTDFLALPLTPEHRTSFEVAVTMLSPRDNLRRALTAARIPWAGAKQWKEFARAAQQVAAARRRL